MTDALVEEARGPVEREAEFLLSRAAHPAPGYMNLIELDTLTKRELRAASEKLAIRLLKLADRLDQQAQEIERLERERKALSAKKWEPPEGWVREFVEGARRAVQWPNDSPSHVPAGMFQNLERLAGVLAAEQERSARRFDQLHQVKEALRLTGGLLEDMETMLGGEVVVPPELEKKIRPALDAARVALFPNEWAELSDQEPVEEGT